MKRKPFLLPVLVCITGTLSAQMVTTDPGFPTAGEEVRVYYNTSQDEGGELENYTGELYAHTGVIIEGSTSWQHVIGTWGDNTTQPKLNYLGDYLYELVITPDIRTYYGVEAGETVKELAFVFRNAAGDKQTRPDIFIEVYPEGLSVSITSPEELTIAEPSSNISLEAIASEEADMTLFLNGSEVTSVTGTDLSHLFQFPDPGDYRIKVTAETAEESAVDSVFVHILGDAVYQTLPEGAIDGINTVDDHTVHLVLHAPGKEHVFVIGDFNNWTPSSTSRMNLDPVTNRWWITLTDMEAGVEYAFQYLVDGELRIADPYTEKVLDPWNDPYISKETYPDLRPYPTGYTTEPVSVFQTGGEEYMWTHDTYTLPGKQNLLIYELLLRDFLESHDWQTLTDTLNYLENLGVNAIELMPVNEFEGNLSWGYNPSFYFAPDKYYGPADDLKAFIDSCHGRNMAVILDMVLNHSFGQSPMVRLYWDEANERPSAENPWYNPVPTHDYNVGYDFNHESVHTRNFSKRVMKHWMENYRADGYRFDLSKGFTQKNTLGNVAAWGTYDETRVAIWKMYADYMWSLNPDFYVILEHFADNTEEKELAEYGMMLWGNLNYEYAEAVMGYSSDLSWGSSVERGWTVPHLITYMESHDEERLMYKMLTYGAELPGYSTRNLETALSRMELATVFLLGLPGPKMIWQFGELGYDYSIDYNGRLGEKPIRWDYVWYHPRHRIYQLFSFMAGLRKDHEVFSTSDYQYSLAGSRKRINLNHPDMDVVILGNFDLVEGTVNPAFQNTGKWYEYFSGDSLEVTDVNNPITLAPGEYRLYTNRKLTQPRFVVSAEDVPFPSVPEGSVHAWPNPSSGPVSLEWYAGHDRSARFRIFDISGKIIVQREIHSAGNGLFRFVWDGTTSDGAPAKPGLYFILVEGENSRGTTRMIKH